MDDAETTLLGSAFSSAKAWLPVSLVDSLKDRTPRRFVVVDRSVQQLDTLAG